MRASLQAAGAEGASHEAERQDRLVAGREFLAAVMNKGFVIGLLLMPAIIALLVVVMPRLMNTQRAAGSR